MQTIGTSSQNGLAVYDENAIQTSNCFTPAAHRLMYGEIAGHDGAKLKDFLPVTFFLNIWIHMLFKVRPITVDEIWGFGWVDRQPEPKKALVGDSEEDTLKVEAFRESLGLEKSMHYPKWVQIRNAEIAKSNRQFAATGQHTAFYRNWVKTLYVPVAWVKVQPDGADDCSVNPLVIALRKEVKDTGGKTGCLRTAVDRCRERGEAMVVGSFFCTNRSSIVAASGAPYAIVQGKEGRSEVRLRDSRHSNLMKFVKNFAAKSQMAWLMPRDEMLAVRKAKYERELAEAKAEGRARSLSDNAYGFEGGDAVEE